MIKDQHQGMVVKTLIAIGVFESIYGGLCKKRVVESVTAIESIYHRGVIHRRIEVQFQVGELGACRVGIEIDVIAARSFENVLRIVCIRKLFRTNVEFHRFNLRHVHRDHHRQHHAVATVLVLDGRISGAFIERDSLIDIRQICVTDCCITCFANFWTTRVHSQI